MEMAEDKRAMVITNLDYPDPDVIRVDDTYYMVSTTMYFMPGCEILKSKDLINWEHATFVYDYLDGTDGHKLKGDKNIYGKGMWAASLAYNKGTYYVVFAANDTQKTYIYSTTDIEGKWEKRVLNELYYDNSLFFDDDGRVYIIYGHNNVFITELKKDLSGAQEGGLNRLLIEDSSNKVLGYEGSHFYKIDGKYFLFNIHSLSDRWRRVVSYHSSDSLEGEFVGGDCFDYDLDYCNQGIAQGGLVETKDGAWFSILFQDRGAVGRIPVLVPVIWQDGKPVFGVGKIDYLSGKGQKTEDSNRIPLVQSDDFRQIQRYKNEKFDCFGFKSCWQFNHEPDVSLIEHDITGGGYSVITDKICKNVTQAKNTLTQRMIYPGCSGEITVDASMINDGDFCGLCALQGYYGLVAITKRDGRNYLVMKYKSWDDNGEITAEEIEFEQDKVTFKIDVDFTYMKDEAYFYYKVGENWEKIGVTHKLRFSLDHFTGCRFGLFSYSTKTVGGKAFFSDFVYAKK